MEPVLSLNSIKEVSQEKQLRIKLAAAYRILAQMKMDDLTYTHLSARLPGSEVYFIYPFGQLFEEVTASSLLKVSLDGIFWKEKKANIIGQAMLFMAIFIRLVLK